MAWTERYVRADAAGGGDGTTDTNSGANGAWTLAEAVAGVAAGHRVNVRAGSYTSLAATTFATAGTTTAPIWWRGFTSAIGDLDSFVTTARVIGTDIPDFQFGTNASTVTGIFQWFSNIQFGGARTAGAQMVLTGTTNNTQGKFFRCRFKNTGTNANSSALSTGGGANCAFSECYFEATSSATRVVELVRQGCVFNGCALRGGGIGLDVNSTNASTFAVKGCSFYNQGSDGIKFTASPIFFLIDGNSIYSAGGDGIEMAAVAAVVHGFVSNNLITDSAGYGINNSSGGNIATVFRSNNSFYNNTSGAENGFGDTPSVREQAEGSSPFTDAGSGDLSLVTGANAKAKGLPGLFEGETFRSYLDIGAVQRQEPSSSSVAVEVNSPFVVAPFDAVGY